MKDVSPVLLNAIQSFLPYCKISLLMRMGSSPKHVLFKTKVLYIW